MQDACPLSPKREAAAASSPASTKSTSGEAGNHQQVHAQEAAGLPNACSLFHVHWDVQVAVKDFRLYFLCDSVNSRTAANQ